MKNWRRPKLWALFLSLMLHGFVFYFISERKIKSKRINEILLVEWHELKPKQGGVNKKPPKYSKVKKGAKNKAKRIRLSQLLPSSRGDVGPYDRQGPEYNHGQSDSLPDDPGAPWGEGAGEFGRLRDYNKIEKVAFEFFHLIDYPYVLMRRGIEGHVNARLVVDNYGRCVWKKTCIGGERPELRMKVLLMLRSFCTSDFWHRLKIRKSSNLDFSFHFDVQSKDNDVQYQVSGNTIFYHIPGRQGTGMWQLGPLKGHFLYPMVFLDPAWVMENWSRFVDGEDPMEVYREAKEIRDFDSKVR